MKLQYQARLIVLWLSKRLWFRPAFFCLAAVGVVLLAMATDQFVDEIPYLNVSQEAIKDVLSIIASSMLAVAIFAVSVMNAAYSSAINATTPRAFEIVVADNSTTQALSSFIGAFIFAVVGIIGIDFGSFGDAGRVVMFGMTLWVFAWVIGTFVYWIDHVTRLGQMRNTIELVCDFAGDALTKYLSAPTGKATPVSVENTPPLGAAPVKSSRGGIVQYVSDETLIALADEHGLEFDLALRSGQIVTPGALLCHVSGKVPDDELVEKIQNCFRIGAVRDPEQDPEMSVRLLAEIADRALSPGVNDPGTATDVIDGLTMVFSKACHVEKNGDMKEPVDPRVRIPMIDSEVLIRAAFEQIGRDGAGQVEVAERLQKAMRSICQILPDDLADATRLHAGWALERAEQALNYEWERERVRAAARVE